MEEVLCDDCGKDNYSIVELIDADYEYLRIIADKFTRRQFRVVKCNYCSLIYLNPRPDTEEIINYYPKEYACYGGVPPQGFFKKLLYDANFYFKIHPLLKLLPENGTLLEYGCGNGHWLWGMKKYLKTGQKIIGMDFNQEQIEKVKKLGIEAYTGDEKKLLEIIPLESVDIVFLNHVIEHVPAPKNLMLAIHRVLKPSGVIYGATPNIDAWDPKIFGQYWFGLQAPRHFYLFTRSTLAAYAEKTGFQVLAFKNDPETSTHWAGSLNTVISEKWWNLPKDVSQVPFYPLLLVLGILVTGVQMLFSKTSIMTFILKKSKIFNS